MIQKLERKLIKSIGKLFSDLEKNKIKKALNFAKKKHQGQFLCEKIPYIAHPIRVALILIEELKNKDTEIICAALLHDVIEDCEVNSSDLKKSFGQEVLKLVLGVTRIRPDNESEEEKSKNKLKKIREISKSNKRIRLLKLCDVLDNARSEIFISPDSNLIKKIPRWHREFIKYLPIVKKTNKDLFNFFKQIKNSWQN